MNCDDMQEWILEAAPASGAAAGHLARCEACRDLLRLHQTLDEQLTQAYTAPTAHPDFRARLHVRVRTEKRRGLWDLAGTLAPPAAGLLTGAICAQLVPAVGPLALAAGLGLALTSYLGQLLFTWLTEELGEG